MSFAATYCAMWALVVLRLRDEHGLRDIGAVFGLRGAGTWIAVATYALGAFAVGQAVWDGDVAVGIAFGYLLVAAWTDLRSREVYLPLTVATLVAVVAVDAVSSHALDRLTAAVAWTLLGLGLHAITRGNGFGLADVMAGAIALLALGPTAGASTIGYAFVLGALVGVALIACRLATRKTPMPLVTFIALAAVVVQSPLGAHLPLGRLV